MIEVTLSPEEAEWFDELPREEQNAFLQEHGIEIGRGYRMTNDSEGNVTYYQED